MISSDTTIFEVLSAKMIKMKTKNILNVIRCQTQILLLRFLSWKNWWDQRFLEYAKLRASCAYVPYVLTCLACLRSFVHLLLVCLPFIRALHALFFYLPYVSSFLRALCAFNFFTCLTCLISKMWNNTQPNATSWN